jgi:DNA-binding transcriptional LysR family regulator
MELEQIRIFTAVARHLSFTAAAAELFISHSTTSRAVSALEQELGVRLLERSGNRIFGLTKAGQILLRDGSRLLAESEELKKKLRSADRTRRDAPEGSL